MEEKQKSVVKLRIENKIIIGVSSLILMTLIITSIVIFTTPNEPKYQWYTNEMRLHTIWGRLTILAVIFLVVGTASLIYDILTFDKDTYARIAYFYTGTMFTIMSQAVSTISKIPQYIVTGILTLMRFSSSVVSATISLVVTFLKMVFPPAVHASEMLSAISKGKSFIVHYNTILYSSYSII